MVLGGPYIKPLWFHLQRANVPLHGPLVDQPGDIKPRSEKQINMFGSRGSNPTNSKLDHLNIKHFFLGSPILRSRWISTKSGVREFPLFHEFDLKDD